MSADTVQAPERALDAIGQVIDCDGVRLWYAEEGTGPPLVLLGGFTAGHNVFELVWPHLREHFRVITWEPRGLGESDCPDPAETEYGVDMWAGDLARLLDRLGIEETSIWAQGFSTYYAIRFAARWPERVTAMVAYSDVWAEDPSKGYAPIWHVYRSIVESFGTTGFGARVLAHVFDVPNPAWFYAWERENIERVLHPETVVATVGYCLTQADVRDDLSAVSAPVLVLQGDGDWGGGAVASDADRADVDEEDRSLQIMRERLAELEISVIDGVHPGYVLIQRPEECARRVKDFLSRRVDTKVG